MLARVRAPVAPARNSAAKRTYYRGTPYFHVQEAKPYKAPTPVTAKEAVNAAIRDNQHIFLHGATQYPQHIVETLVNELNGKVKNVEFHSIHTDGNGAHLRPDLDPKSFHTSPFFCGANERAAVARGGADYIPVFLSETPLLFRRGVLPCDVAIIMVSPPDKHGFCSLGLSIEATLGALEMAKCVIAQVNKYVPRTHGDGQIHVSNIDYIVEHDQPLFEHPQGKLSENEKKIGEYVASVIPDRACLQLGIGGIPDAVARALKNHKDLGVHTEMFSDGIVDLYHQGAITNRYKVLHPGELLTSFAIGSKKLFDFVDDNPSVIFRDTAFVNDTANIRKNANVCAINSCLEVDITGQVCADSIGTKHYSGVGGQMDFIRGASLSEGGKPILALESQTNKGETKIVPTLKVGAGVVTTRAHVHYIATEYGIVDLYGKNLRQRAQALIKIAHPNHRDALTQAAKQRFGKDFTL